MKKLVLILCAALALFSMPIGAAADTVTFIDGPYDFGSGGEFTMIPTGSISNYLVNYASTTKNRVAGSINFQTFCIEELEHISFGQTYTAVLNPAAVEGGVQPGPDPISKGTAYLYSKFATGTLQDYNYAGTVEQRQASAALLQNAIWFLEFEGGGVDNYYVDLVQGIFGQGDTDTRTGGAFDDNAGLYSVYALNLTQGATKNQDVLIYTPEPLTMLLLGIGLVGLAGLRRKE